jgi:hypothetical protein
MTKKHLVLAFVFLCNMITLQAQKNEKEFNIDQKKKIVLF